MWSRSSFLVAAFLASWAAAFLGCHLEPEEEIYLEVQADTTWFVHDSVTVLLADSTGRTLEVLRHGPLDSLAQLDRLEARKFSGGRTVLVLIAYQDDLAVRRETRTYDGGSQTTVERKVETDIHALNPGRTARLDLGPDTLRLYQGGSTAVLKPAPADAWEGKSLDWSSSDAGVAVVSKGVVTPAGPGVARIRAQSGFSADSVTVIVTTDAPVLTVGEDTTVHAPVTLAFRVKVAQEHGGIALFKWSLDRDTAWDDSLQGFPENQAVLITDARTFTVPGQYLLRFLIEDGEGNRTVASRSLTVVGQSIPKAPIVDAGGDITVQAGDLVTLFGSAYDPDGSIVSREWLSEGGIVELWNADTFVFQTGTVGVYRYIFRVIDSDGQSGSDTVQVTVLPASVDRPPEAFGILVENDFPSDGYRMVFTALLRANGAALTCFWDYDGDGFTDEVTVLDSKGGDAVDSLVGYFQFASPGQYRAALRVVDPLGREAVASVWVTITGIGINGLSSLSLNAGTLVPDFLPSIRKYWLQVPKTQVDIRFTAVPHSTDAYLRINGVEIANGELSQSFPLALGENFFDIEVHNPTGEVVYYTITLNRS